MSTQPVTLDPISRLSRDIKSALVSLSEQEARYLVDAYYTIQSYRIQSANQVRALSKSDEPHEILNWLEDNNQSLENQIKRALDAWTDTRPLGRWAKSVTGIGPVIAAGLLAHIDIKQAPTVGHIWRFAGLDPTSTWEKSTKRPWNASLKVICWKMGESFVKVSGNPKDIYGQTYLSRKRYEAERNEAQEFAGQAVDALAKKKIGKDTDAYKWYSGTIDPRLAGWWRLQGYEVSKTPTVKEVEAAQLLAVVDQLPAKAEELIALFTAAPAFLTSLKGKPMLPPGHLHARAKRYAVKLFLSHYHDVAYRLEFKVPPPKPYPIAHLGHVDFIAPSACAGLAVA